MMENLLKRLYSYSIIVIWISRYFYINAGSELENLTTIIDNITTREIENVTCIVDKYGVGYVGIQNKTKYNQPCIEWNKLVLDELNFGINIKNISRNYCRNIDADPRGPWCFVNGLSTIRSFRFRRFCQIPLCKFKIRPASSEINLGVHILSNRNCPYGFTKQIKTRNSENITYCQVKQEYLNKLPSGHYSFQIMNPENATICPGGFKTEKLFSLYKNYYCTRIDSSNNSIEFPRYLSPNSNELIFIAHRIGSDSFCPRMRSNNSIVIRNSTTNYSSDLKLLSCYYFYKVANKTVDRKLAILADGRCPKNWERRKFTSVFRIKILIEYGIRVYVCIPKKDTYNYPDGDYCLFSALSRTLSDIQCPEGFLDVNFKQNGKIHTKLCCRQSIKSSFENQNLYDYFNFSSIMIINSADKCAKSNNKNFIGIQHVFYGLYHTEDFNCANCDLFKVFNIKQKLSKEILFKVRFRFCSYEENKSGFAYVSLKTFCPPGMNFGLVVYSIPKYSDVSEAFCSVLNYPKNISFPDGQYCVYKIGFECPPGFKTVKYKNELYRYKHYLGGDLELFKHDENCCKFGLENITFKNTTLPYVSKNFEFGLPLANNSFNCIHGLGTHTAVEEWKICNYYPITENYRFSSVYTSSDCSYGSPTFSGSYRFTYSPNASIQYCHLYVNNRPPPGNYCVIFSKKCPSEYFDYVTYHPLMRKVICCRKPTLSDSVVNESEFTFFEWIDQIKSFSLLPHKNKCPVFNQYNYGKEPTKQDYNYRASEISASHRKNLSDIGIKIKKTDRGYLVTIYICNYKLDLHNKSTTWPHGNYSFPKPLTGCPSNFKSGEYTQSMESATASFAHSDAIHLDSDYMIGGSSIKWSFCVKNDNYVRDQLLLPFGRYCLMKVDDDCPLNFQKGSVKFVEYAALDKLRINRTGVLPKIETTGPFITYYFCCRSGRGYVVHDPMYLPTESGSFYLLKYGTYCQKVYGMKFTEEFNCIDSEDSQQYLNFTLQASYKIVGATPVTRNFDKRCTLQINLCYYELDSSVSNPTTSKPGPLISWPPGSYLFIKPLQSRCPPGFNQGSILAQTIFKVRPKFMHILMFGPTEDNKAVFSYCKRNSTNNDKSRPAENWPSGNYCFIFEKKCPSGMVSHKFRSLSYFFYLKESSKTMAEWARLCCKIENNSNSVPLPFFPGHFYSIIIQRTVNTHLCPPHQKARVVLVDLQSEIICYYERMDESIEFPVGEYLLPAPQKPMNACAPGFILVEHRHSALGGADKPSKHLKFCQKDNSGYKNGTFPTGNYCILTSNSRCPSNQFTIENMLTIPFYHFADQIHKYSRYLACCQRDDKIISNIATPKIPFRLYGSSPCSYVDGLVNVVENFEETSLIQQSGLERPPYSRAESKLRICEYDQTPNWNFEKNCNCHSNAICSLEFQDKNCQCRTGYFGDGKKICSKITNETDKCADVCDKNVSVCMKSAYSDDYSCNCKEGYSGDKFKCWPSCQTRHCNDFSKCVVNMTKSSCTCLSGNVKSDDGSCHGDMISTISILPELFNLTQLNLSCLRKDARDHLFIPKLDQTLVVLIPSDAKVFSSCFEVNNYYGFHYKTSFELGNSSRFSFWTFKHVWILISKMEENVWSIGKNITAVGRIIFNNAMIFYLNGSLVLKSHESDFEIGEKKRYTTKAVVVFVFTGISLFVLIFIMLFIINWKRHLCIPRRIFEARSASNIHFATEGDDIMMES